MRTVKRVILSGLVVIAGIAGAATVFVLLWEQPSLNKALIGGFTVAALLFCGLVAALIKINE